MHIEKRCLRRLDRLFGDLSVSLKLLDGEGAALLPESENGFSLPQLASEKENSGILEGWRWLRMEARSPLYLAVPEDAPGGDDLLRISESLVMSVLGEDFSIAGQEDVYKMILRQEVAGAELETLAKEHQIPMEGQRCVMLIRLRNPGENLRVSDILPELLPLSEKDVLLEMDAATAALVRDMHGVDGLEELRQFAMALQETLLEEAMQQTVVSIGEIKHSLAQLGESYSEAKQAMDIGLRFEPEESVHLFSRLLLDRFLDSLPPEDCQRWHGLLFNRKTAKLLSEEMLQTIDMFFRKDLNLSDTARQLYIHRNTLVYRLDKVQRATGLDLRRFDDALTFKMLYKLKNCISDNKAKKS